MPKTAFPGEPERLARCAVGEFRCHLRVTTLGFAAQDMIKVRFEVSATDGQNPIPDLESGLIESLPLKLRGALLGEG
jgi:hypothetical protein